MIHHNDRSIISNNSDGKTIRDMIPDFKINKHIKILIEENEMLRDKLEKCKVFVPASLISDSESK